MAKASTFDDPLVLEAALEGLELQKKRIDAQIGEIRARLARRPRAVSEEAPASKRKLSADARKRIAAAQKKRWAEYRKAKPNSK